MKDHFANRQQQLLSFTMLEQPQLPNVCHSICLAGLHRSELCCLLGLNFCKQCSLAVCDSRWAFAVSCSRCFSRVMDGNWNESL